MKERAIYYRKKNKGIVIEGRLPNSKPLLIWTLPEPLKLLSKIIENPSLFPKEKADKIREKIMRLDYKKQSTKKHKSKVHIPIIRRTSIKDGLNKFKAQNIQIKELWEITK